MNRRWAFASLVLVGAMASALFLTNDAYAARPAYNNSEIDAWNNYLRYGVCGQGALWFNDKNGNYGPSNDWERGYYSTGVQAVAHNQEYITIYLHGSAVMGGECTGDPFYATRIQSLSSRLTIHGTNLLRGYGDASGWTSIGGSLPATLDIRNVATPGDPNGQVIYLTFWRCGDFKENGSLNRCRQETLPVRIIRRASPWRAEGDSYIRRETAANKNVDRDWQKSTLIAKPGETISFTHRLAMRDANANQQIRHTIRGHNLPRSPHIPASEADSVIDYGWSSPPLLKDTFIQHYGPYPGAKNPWNVMRYTVKASDAGKNICQRIEWAPASYNGGVAGSNYACAVVPYEYTLRPSIDVASTTIMLGQKKVSGVQGSIYNSGPTRSKSTRSAVVRFVAKAGNTIAESGDNVKMSIENPCELAAHIAAKHGVTISGACKDLYKDGSDRDFPVNQTMIHSSDDDINGLPVQSGDRVCYVTVVAAYKQEVGKETSSYAVKCVVVSKKPKVQFWGGDVRAGVSFGGATSKGLVQTSMTILDDKRYGSWAEYGILSPQNIISASGAGLSDGGPAGGLAREYNTLTFRNTKTPYGQFGRLTGYNYPAIKGTDSGSIKIGDGQLSGNAEYRAAQVEITGGTVKTGAYVTVYGRTVRITGDITYANGPLSSVGAIPQLIIRADYIIIEPNVQRVDAWLLANKTVSTCAEAKNGKGWPEADLLASGACDKQQLRVNGPIVTGSLYLRRTHGSDQTDFGKPAEILNLRPDAYLANYGRSRDSGAIQTMYSRELPPRF